MGCEISIRLPDKGGCKRQQSHVPSPLDGQSQYSLMLGTITGDSAWRDFSPFSGKIPEGPGILIIDDKTAVSTELAHLPSVKSPSDPVLIIIIASSMRSIVGHFLPHHNLLFRSLPLILSLLQSLHL